MKNLVSLICIIITVFSIGMNIALLTIWPNYDKRLLFIAEKSYFTGCAVQTKDFDKCRMLSKAYREDFRISIGLRED